MTSQNWSGWCRTHWFLVGVEKHDILLEVSGRQPHCTHHHCQLRSHMMSHDMMTSHHQPVDHLDYITGIYSSPVPRPHSLTRRNSLVNQVEFLGLVHTFAVVSPSNVQPAQKRYGCSSRDIFAQNYIFHQLFHSLISSIHHSLTATVHSHVNSL